MDCFCGGLYNERDMHHFRTKLHQRADARPVPKCSHIAHGLSGTGDAWVCPDLLEYRNGLHLAKERFEKGIEYYEEPDIILKRKPVALNRAGDQPSRSMVIYTPQEVVEELVDPIDDMIDPSQCIKCRHSSDDLNAENICEKCDFEIKANEVWDRKRLWLIDNPVEDDILPIELEPVKHKSTCPHLCNTCGLNRLLKQHDLTPLDHTINRRTLTLLKSN